MIHSLKTSRRNRAILSDYRARDATRWSEEDRAENIRRNKHMLRKYRNLEDEMEADRDIQMQMSLGERYQRDIMQKVIFTDGLLNELYHYSKNAIPSLDDDVSSRMTMNQNGQKTTYPVTGTRYNDTLADKILDKTLKSYESDSENEKTNSAVTVLP
jgi:hypothetical protein